MKFESNIFSMDQKIAVALFASCLPLSAFYIDSNQEPVNAFGLLLSGWLGTLTSEFSWFANPVFLAAFEWRRTAPRKSLVAAVLAILLGLSFLTSDGIQGLDDSSRITGYGWGYFLWIQSFIVFAFGQFSEISISEGLEFQSRHVRIFGGSVVASFAALFIYYFYVSANGPNRIERDRDEYFSAHCSEAIEVITEYPRVANGIYFSPGTEDVLGQQTLSTIVDIGLVTFYETQNQSHDSSLPFRRYERGNSKGTPVTTLASEYSVVRSTLSPEPRPELNIGGLKVSIVDNAKKVTIATTTVISQSPEVRVCGKWDVRGFIRRVFRI